MVCADRWRTAHNKIFDCDRNFVDTLELEVRLFGGQESLVEHQDSVALSASLKVVDNLLNRRLLFNLFCYEPVQQWNGREIAGFDRQRIQTVD